MCRGSKGSRATWKTGDGDSFEVTPQINSKGEIILEVASKSEQVVGEGEVSTQAMNSHVRFSDDKVYVLSGSVSEKEGKRSERLLFLYPSAIRPAN